MKILMTLIIGVFLSLPAWAETYNANDPDLATQRSADTFTEAGMKGGFCDLHDCTDSENSVLTPTPHELNQMAILNNMTGGSDQSGASDQ